MTEAIEPDGDETADTTPRAGFGLVLIASMMTLLAGLILLIFNGVLVYRGNNLSTAEIVLVWLGLGLTVIGAFLLVVTATVSQD